MSSLDDDYDGEALKEIARKRLPADIEQLRQLQQRGNQALYGQMERAVASVDLASRKVAEHLPKSVKEGRDGE